MDDLQPRGDHTLQRLEISPLKLDICVQEDQVWPVVVVGGKDADESKKTDLLFVKVDEMHNVWHNELA